MTVEWGKTTKAILPTLQVEREDIEELLRALQSREPYNLQRRIRLEERLTTMADYWESNRCHSSPRGRTEK